MAGVTPDTVPNSSSGAKERRCLYTGKVTDAAAMVRLVLAPDGGPVPDVEGKLPGRGGWVTADRAAIEGLVNKGGLSARLAAGGGGKRRAVKDSRPSMAGRDFADLTERLLARRCRDWMGLARRAGQAVSGFEKVRRCLMTGQAAVLLAASDGASDGKEKLARLTKELPVLEIFSSEELSLALGAKNVIHAALLRGPLAQRLIGEASRLAGLRDGSLAGSSAS